MEIKELVEQSLLRLPIKDIIRFGCVSKPWYSRIFSCEFSHKYLKFQANNNNNNKLNLMLHGTHGSFHSISYDYSNGQISAPTPTPTPTLLDNQNHPLLVHFIESQNFEIVGSCDGLLLVAVTTPEVHVASAIYIWNPTTRVYKVLPKLVTTPGPVPSKVFGFGRVPTTDNNYKVVFLETISSTQEDLVFKVHLYTTHTNSWETLPYTIPYFSTSCGLSLTMELAYDNLHFVPEVDHRYQREDPIISFDLKDNKFRVIVDPCCDQFPTLDFISALNGGLVALTRSSHGKTICLSMMENFGEEDERWAKKYCLNHPSTIGYPNMFFSSVLGIRQDGQILLSTHSHRYQPGNTNFIRPCVVCYNTNTNRAETLYHLSFRPLPVVYVESLISPHSTDDRVEGQEGKFKRRRTCLQGWRQLHHLDCPVRSF